MIEFVRVSAKWFLSLGVVSLDLANRGLVYVGGKNLDDASFDANGAGKSSIFEAIVWCLYGSTIRSIDADEVINERRPAGNGTEVGVYFRLRGAHYVIVRYRDAGPNKNAVRLFKSLSTPGLLSFSAGVMTAGMQELTKRDNRETDAMIVQLLGMDYLTFTTVVFFGQGLSTRFAGMTDSQKKEVMERIIGLERYAVARKKAAEAVAAANLQIQGATIALDSANQRHDDLMTRYKLDREDNTRWLAKKSQRRAELVKEINNTKEWLEDYNNVIVPAMRAAKAGREESKKLVASLQADVLRTQEAATKAEAAFSVAKDRLDSAKMALDTAKAKTPGVLCGSCGQVTTLATLVVSERKAQIAYDFQVKATENAKNELIAAKARKKVAQDSMKAAQDEYAKHEMEIMRLSVSSGSAVAMETSLKTLEAQLSGLSAEKNPYPKRINELVAKIKDTRERRQKIKVDLKKAEVDAQVFGYWERGFSNKGLRSLLLDASVPLLNKYAAEYSTILTDGNLSVEFSTQSLLKSGQMAEKFEVRVNNLHGGSGYGAASGGETVKADLIVGLSLQRLVASRALQVTNIAVYDEAFIYLDDEAMNRVVQLLAHEAKLKSSVFVITHEAALKQYFPTEITVTKKSGISSLK